MPTCLTASYGRTLSHVARRTEVEPRFCPISGGRNHEPSTECLRKGDEAREIRAGPRRGQWRGRWRRRHRPRLPPSAPPQPWPAGATAPRLLVSPPPRVAAWSGACGWRARAGWASRSPPGSSPARLPPRPTPCRPTAPVEEPRGRRARPRSAPFAAVPVPTAARPPRHPRQSRRAGAQRRRRAPPPRPVRSRLPALAVGSRQAAARQLGVATPGPRSGRGQRPGVSPPDLSSTPGR